MESSTDRCSLSGIIAHCKLLPLGAFFLLIMLGPGKEAVYAGAVVDDIGAAISHYLAKLMVPMAEVGAREVIG